MKNASAALLAVLVCLCAASAASAAAAPAGEAAFRGVYKELVETNTALSSGSCTLAAERMAVHLRTAGFPDSGPCRGRRGRGSQQRRGGSGRRSRNEGARDETKERPIRECCSTGKNESKNKDK